MNSPRVLATQYSNRFPSLFLIAVPIAIAICTFLKMVYFSLLISNAWWNTGPMIQILSLKEIAYSLSARPIVLSSTLAVLLLLFSLIPLLRRGSALFFILSIDSVFTFIGLSHLMYVRFRGDVLSLSNLPTYQLLHAILPSVAETVDARILWCFLDVILGLLILPWYLRIVSDQGTSPQRLKSRGRKTLSVISLILAFSLMVPAAKLILENRKGMFSNTGLRIELSSSIGILAYQFYDAALFLLSGKKELSGKEIQKVRSFFSERMIQETQPSSFFGKAKGRNVILISAESLQAWVIGLQIGTQAVTPRLNSFAKESLFFGNFYHQAHLGTTSDAEFIVMQSLHPVASGVLVQKYSENQFQALPEILQRHGYATISATGEPSGFWNMQEMHHKLGFQRSYFEDSYKMVEKIGPWLSDEEFFKQTVPFLQSEREPFLAYLLSSSNHDPFPLPKKYQELQLNDLSNRRVQNYLQSVHYFDRAFGHFVDRLRDTGLLNRSVIILYGDHDGCSDDPAAQLAGLSNQKELDLFKLRKKVPLFIRLPHGEGASEYRNAGGQMDVAPTILGLLGIRNEGNIMLGQDLTRAKDSFVVFRDGSFFNGSKFYIVNWEANPNASCYENSSGRQIDCGSLLGEHKRAVDQLQISDAVLQGNLIASFTQDKIDSFSD